MNPPADSLAGKVALITGAGSGLGEAVARLLAACGARVAVVDWKAAEAARVADAIAAAGGTALALATDVSDSAQLAAAVQRVDATWQRLDIVCANAGINGAWAPLHELTPEEWDATQAVNLKGTFLTVRASVELLKRSGGGSVIITSSVVGSQVFSLGGATSYAASKAGQIAFGRMSALELAKHRIRVNTICPGAFRSNIASSTQYRNRTGLVPVVQYPEGSVPLTKGLAATPDKVANVVWFLASEFSEHVTGAEITVDGGQTLVMG